MNGKSIALFVTLSLVYFPALRAEVTTDYADFVGMGIFAQDPAETYLGYITSDSSHSHSIIREGGDYGSPYSPASIRNPSGSYGSSNGIYSAYNPNTINPPLIKSWNGSRLVTEAYLTKSLYLSGYPSVDPDGLIHYLLHHGSLPDLQVSAFWWQPDQTEGGEPFSIKVTVYNGGIGAAGPSQVKAYLSRDNDLDVSDDYDLGFRAVEGLSSGSSEDIHWSFVFPDLGVGSYQVWLLAVIDESAEVEESDEANTWLSSGSFTVEPRDIPNQIPNINNFTADRDSGIKPFQVCFACTAHDPDGEIETYEIDFGDGSERGINTEGIFTHSYTKAGIFDAFCTVLDNQGASASSAPLRLHVRERWKGLPFLIPLLGEINHGP